MAEEVGRAFGEERGLARARPGDDELWSTWDGQRIVLRDVRVHSQLDPRPSGGDRDHGIVKSELGSDVNHLCDHREADTGGGESLFCLCEECCVVVHTVNVRPRCDRICSVNIRPLETVEIEIAVAMNNAEVPNVGPTDIAHFAQFVDYPGVVWAADGDAGVVGLLVAVAPGAAYASPNYRWFDERWSDFIYVDRVVVSPEAKGQGIGRAFYELLAERYAGEAKRITCEVNLDPPNEASMSFHRRMGFEQVGTTNDGPKTVAMLSKILE